MKNVKVTCHHYLRDLARPHKSSCRQKIWRHLAIGSHCCHPLRTIRGSRPVTPFPCTPRHPQSHTTPHNHTDTTHYRICIDRLDPQGKASLRRAGKMHHLGARIINARKRVLTPVDDTTVTVTELTTGEVLSQHLIEPDKSYWPDILKPKGRWPEL
jgi:hypothetical protein